MPDRSSPPLVMKLGLAVVATLFAFGLCEVFARIKFPRPSDVARQPRIVYRFDPEIGYVLSPNQQGWFDEGWMTVNSLGFRGREVETPKPAGRFRIVVIGDSVASGLGVSDDETFASQMERVLTPRFSRGNLDVVNLAVGGYNTRQEVTLLRRNLEKLDPDLVLLGFYVNDIEGSLENGRPADEGGTRIVAENPQPGQVLHLETESSSWLNHQLRRSRLIYLVGREVTYLMHRGEWGSSRFAMEQDILHDKVTPEIEKGWTNVEKAMNQLRLLADSRFRVGIVVLPCKEQVTGEYRATNYEHRLREIAVRLGFFVIDPVPSLAAAQASGDLFIPYDRNHPNAAGHRVIGQAVADRLVAEGVLSEGR